MPIGSSSAVRREERPEESESDHGTSRASPTAPTGRVRANRSRLTRLGPQLRHEEHDEQIGDDVDRDVEGRDQDRDRLHFADIADRDGVDELLPEPGVGEQVLDHDDPADEVLEVLREHLDRRREGVAQRVAHDDQPLAECR